MFNFFRGNAISDVTMEEVNSMPRSKLVHLLSNSYKRMSLSEIAGEKEITYGVLDRMGAALSSHKAGREKLSKKDIKKYIEIVVTTTELLKTDDPLMQYYASDLLQEIGDEKASDAMISFFGEIVKPDVPICKWPICGTISRVLTYFYRVPDSRVIDNLLKLWSREEEWKECRTRFVLGMIRTSGKLAEKSKDARLVKSLVHIADTLAHGGAITRKARKEILHFFSYATNLNVQLLSDFTREEIRFIGWTQFYDERKWSRAIEFWDLVLSNMDRFSFTTEEISRFWYQKGLAVFYNSFPSELKGGDSRVTDKHEQANACFQRSIEYAKEWTEYDGSKTLNKSFEVFARGKNIKSRT